MTDLSDQEMALLDLMAQGQSMMAIGQWEKPMEALVVKGYATRHDQFNHTATEAGLEVVARMEADEDAEIEAAFRQVTGIPVSAARRNTNQ